MNQQVSGLASVKQRSLTLGTIPPTARGSSYFSVCHSPNNSAMIASFLLSSRIESSASPVLCFGIARDLTICSTDQSENTAFQRQGILGKPVNLRNEAAANAGEANLRRQLPKFHFAAFSKPTITGMQCLHRTPPKNWLASTVSKHWTFWIHCFVLLKPPLQHIKVVCFISLSPKMVLQHE
jgi:hypothetical protein